MNVNVGLARLLIAFSGSSKFCYSAESVLQAAKSGKVGERESGEGDKSQIARYLRTRHAVKKRM